ncbi:response regulator [candidate division KSB1 bacterium]|nr:response regulator [candidate division KSB1 bacterium]
MNRIIILDEELESQMRMYLALCSRYRVEIAEDEATLMRMIRRKNPKLILLDANYSGFNNNGKSVHKTIQKIKKKYSTLKVVTILDRDDMELHRTATQEASDAVLLRPVDEINVLKRVREQLSNAALAVN